MTDIPCLTPGLATLLSLSWSSDTVKNTRLESEAFRKSVYPTVFALMAVEDTSVTVANIVPHCVHTYFLANIQASCNIHR